MKKFVEGDNLTLEDVKQAMKEAHDKNIKQQSSEVITTPKLKMSADGYYEFDSWEEYQKAFGDFASVEEAFKQDK